MFRKSFLGFSDNSPSLHHEEESISDGSETEGSSLQDANKNLGDQSVMSKSEAWENNSDTPDITIEINDSTTTMDDDSSVTEPDEEQTKANMTIDEFLDETETIGAELGAEEDPDEMFTSLITRAAGEQSSFPSIFVHTELFFLSSNLGECGPRNFQSSPAPSASGKFKVNPIF